MTTWPAATGRRSKPSFLYVARAALFPVVDEQRHPVPPGEQLARDERAEGRGQPSAPSPLRRRHAREKADTPGRPGVRGHGEQGAVPPAYPRPALDSGAARTGEDAAPGPGRGSDHQRVTAGRFGKVVQGMDVVDKIRATPTGANDVPLQQVVIKKATVEK